MSARILIINPNASDRCTRGIRAAAMRQAGDEMEVDVLTSTEGPAYVETPRDEVIAAAALLRLLEERATNEYDAYIIACSSDPGLAAVRSTFHVPVLGIGESALLLARGLGLPYGILTNVAADEPPMWEMARGYGLEQHLVSVQAAGYTVEEFDLRKPGASDGLLEAGRRAVESGARSLCLGCAAMAGLEDALTRELGVPVFEGVASAVHLARVYLPMTSLATEAIS